MNLINENEVFEELFNLFLKEFEIDRNRKIPEDKKLTFLKIFSVNYFSDSEEDYLAKVQDRYLQLIQDNSELIDLSELIKNKKAAMPYNPLEIRAEMLVVITPKLLSGGVELQNINSLLPIYGGVRINNDLYSLYKQDKNIVSSKKPYVINGYNLPYQSVAKLIVSKDDAFYIDNLNMNMDELIKIIKLNKFKNILFVIDEHLNGAKNDFIEIINKKIKKLKINTLIM